VCGVREKAAEKMSSVLEDLLPRLSGVMWVMLDNIMPGLSKELHALLRVRVQNMCEHMQAM